MHYGEDRRIVGIDALLYECSSPELSIFSVFKFHRFMLRVFVSRILTEKFAVIMKVRREVSICIVI